MTDMTVTLEVQTQVCKRLGGKQTLMCQNLHRARLHLLKLRSYCLNVSSTILSKI